MKGARLWTFAAFLLGLVLVYVAASQQAVSPSDATALAGTLPSESTTTAGSIWSHNLIVALTELVPIIGIGVAGFSAWITGLTTASITEVGKVPSSAVVEYLMTTPFFWLEFSGYALSLTASLWLIMAAAKKRLRTELPYFVLTAAMMAAILGVSALVEMSYILHP